MRAEARRYIAVETTSSSVVNALLNYGPAWLIFHHHPAVAVAGQGGMFQDSIGETLIVTFLSYLVPTLIARSRRKVGTLPVSGMESKVGGNVYLRSLGVAVLFTVALTGLNALLLPRIFGSSVSLHTELMFKTWWGAVFWGDSEFSGDLSLLARNTAGAGSPVGGRDSNAACVVQRIMLTPALLAEHERFKPTERWLR